MNISNPMGDNYPPGVDMRWYLGDMDEELEEREEEYDDQEIEEN